MNTQQRAQFQAMVKDTILKERRSKTLIFIFIATTLMILLAHSLLKMFIENKDAAFMVTGANSLSFMFKFINIWSLIIAGIFGISSIRSDFKDKIIYQYLTFPITRTQYMLSRIIGTWVLVFSYYLYSYILSAILFSIATNSMALHWTHLVSMLLMGLYVFLVILFSFVFSMMASNIGAFLLLLTSVTAISLASSNFRTLSYSEYLTNLSLSKLLGLLVYFLLPRLNYITELASNVMSNEAVTFNLGLETIHLILTSGLIFFLADRYVVKKNF